MKRFKKRFERSLEREKDETYLCFAMRNKQGYKNASERGVCIYTRDYEKRRGFQTNLIESIPTDLRTKMMDANSLMNSSRTITLSKIVDKVTTGVSRGFEGDKAMELEGEPVEEEVVEAGGGGRGDNRRLGESGAPSSTASSSSSSPGGARFERREGMGVLTITG